MKGVTLVTPPKGIFTIVGKSGSGKSTLLSLLSLLELPSSGEVYFKGNKLSTLPKSKKDFLRSNVFGFVHQKFNLLEEETVLYNIALPSLISGDSLNKANKKAKRLLNKLNLKELDKQNVKVLSGGEKQRVAIARALINDPEVIFADEPTGALDSKSALIVMDTLKEISKNKLVILVSHNQNLVDQYADEAILLKDGELASSISHKIEKSDIKIKSKNRKGFWRNILLKSHLKKDTCKNVLSFLAALIAFFSTIEGIGFSLGSNSSLEKEKEKTLLLYSGSVSNSEEFKIEGTPLTLLKSSRPDLEMINNILEEKKISVHLDYSYFFPYECSFSSKGFSNKAYFSPIYDPSLKEFGNDLLILGTTFSKTDLDFCYVNDVFFNQFNLSVGDNLSVPFSTNVVIDGESHAIELGANFEIKGVVNEFGFLNMPRVYYSYEAYLEKLESSFFDEEHSLSVSSLLRKANGDESYSSYSYSLFAHDSQGKENLFELIKEGEGKKSGILYSSLAYSSISSFSSLHQAISSLLVPFLVLEIVGASFILGSISYSSFLERKKEAAILTSLGAKFSSISFLYLEENLLISFAAMLFALLLSNPLSNFLNAILYNLTKIPSLISIPFASLFGIQNIFTPLCFLLAALITIIGVYTPMLFFKKSSLLSELNDE